MKYFFGILAIALGIVLILKTEWFIANFGTSRWAENHMGMSGGTRLMYKLVGLLFIVIAMLGMTGFLGGIILGIFGNLFGGIV